MSRYFRRFPRLIAGVCYLTMVGISYAIFGQSFLEMGKMIFAIAISGTIALQIYEAADRYNERKAVLLPPPAWIFGLISAALQTVGFIIASQMNAEEDPPVIYYYFGVLIVIAIVEFIYFSRSEKYQEEEKEIPILRFDDYSDDEQFASNFEKYNGVTIGFTGYVHHVQNIAENGFSQIVYLYNKKESNKIKVLCYLSSRMELEENAFFSSKGTARIEEDDYGKTVYKII